MKLPSGGLGIAGNLTRVFIKSPLTPLLLIAAFAVGVIALITLPREEDPQISVPMVDIHVQADGLKAPDAVKLITEPLEGIVRGISGVKHVYSETSDDSVLVTARFKVGTSEDTALLRVHEKIRANLDKIPVGIPEPLIVGRGINDVAIIDLTLTPDPKFAASVTPNELTQVARELKVQVSKIDNVGLTYLVGAANARIRVAPELEKLALYGVTLQELVAKVSGANTAFPAGTVRYKGDEITVEAGRTLSTPEEIGNLMLTTRDDRPVYVRDVANVSLVTTPTTDIVSMITRQDGKLVRAPAVTLAIAKRAGSNAVVVADQVLKRVQELHGSVIPKFVKVSVTRNYGRTANEKSNELLFHLGLATISIVILVWLAIGWREAIVVKNKNTKKGKIGRAHV